MISIFILAVLIGICKVGMYFFKDENLISFFKLVELLGIFTTIGFNLAKLVS